jgi:hypothetical protein
MNVNGRLTAPPQVEVALVTNSVDGMVSGGRNQPTTGGTTLAKFSPGFGTRMREERRISCVGRRAAEGAQMYGWFDPVSATQFLSVSQEAAAGS